LASAGGAHNPVQISRVDLGDGDGAFFAEEAAGALKVAVTAPDCMSLPLQ